MNSEKWHHSEIRIAINDESQGSIAMSYFTFRFSKKFLLADSVVNLQQILFKYPTTL